MTTELWIVVAAVLALLVVVLVVGSVLARRRRISLRGDTQETPREVDRSGGYKASTGFDFSQGTAAPPEPVRRDTRPAPDLVGERTDTDDQPRVGDDASVPRDAPKRGITDVTLPEPATAPEPVAEPEPPV
ncbi:signal recognition particle-docking protein FtsY, partial [Rhodococcus corynebacterioides]|nr:signal recognition particle-docking protein FtsY [Rhodococcus corynebacterioides]